MIDGFGQGWGTPEFIAQVIEGVTPSYVGDAERLEYFASFLRMSASPGAAAALMKMNMGNDVRHVLPAIRVPSSGASSSASEGEKLTRPGTAFSRASTGRRVRSAALRGSLKASMPWDSRYGLVLHTGECELLDGKVAGIAVHTGGRVASEAAPGEVLVSSTVKDLVAGSGLAFHDRGTHELRGVPHEWRLYSRSQLTQRPRRSLSRVQRRS